MSYQPNFNDPRVHKRIVQAIAWATTNLTNEPRSKSQREIADQLGRSDTSIGLYLRNQLLICVDHYYNPETHVCKKYILNQDGLKELRQASSTNKIELKPELQQQLDSGEFEYQDTSDRLFNPIQYIPRRIRQDILTSNNYRHNYDIECAAPTLLYQYAQRSGNLNKNLTYIEHYIANRAQVRNELSIKYNIPLKVIKETINALFQGAYLSHRANTSILTLLGNQHNLINQLKSDPYLTELRQDISAMWRSISREMREGLNKKRLSARDKAAKYRELERLVMDVIKRELRRTKNKFLLLHDGWSCRDVVDITYLLSCVRSSTGYVIKLDWEIWE